MTDRHSAYIVVLEDDIREDDAEVTLNALKQIKGVLEVQPVVNEGAAIGIARIRESARWQSKILNLVLEMNKDS